MRRTPLTPLLLLTVLVAGCGHTATDGGSPLQRFELYVDGSATGTPGPFCIVSLSRPARFSLRSHPQVVDSATAALNVVPGRYRFAWSVDYYNSSGFYNTTLSSGPFDSTDVPGSAYFNC